MEQLGPGGSLDLDIRFEEDGVPSPSASVDLKTRRIVKDAHECSLLWPVDINRMIGNLGLLSSSRLPSQCWFNQSQIIGMGIPNCIVRSFLDDDDDDDDVEEDLVFGDVASFIGSHIINARFP